VELSAEDILLDDVPVLVLQVEFDKGPDLLVLVGNANALLGDCILSPALGVFLELRAQLVAPGLRDFDFVFLEEQINKFYLVLDLHFVQFFSRLLQGQVVFVDLEKFEAEGFRLLLVLS